MLKTSLLPIAAAALALGGCASNYAGEGAIAGGVGGALLGGGTGAVVGAAAGGLIGSIIHKDGHCYRRTRNGETVEVRCR